jgi:hypothetical protein
MIAGHLPWTHFKGLDRLSKVSKKVAGDRAEIVSVLPRIASVEPVIHGVLKIVWLDGIEDVVDLRPTISRGKIFAWLQDPRNFATVRKDEYGHAVGWINDDGEEIDLGADSLRRDAEKQAEIHRLMAS